jgi:hypothetical protein
MNFAATNDGGSISMEPVERLLADGFVLLHQLCGSEFIDSLLQVSRERSSAVRDALGDKPIGIGSAAGFIEIVQRSPGRWDVPITPQQFGLEDRDMPWWPLVTTVLGTDAEHSFSGVVSSEPGSPAQHWHTDSPHVASQHLAAHAINVMVALHDVPMVMGPTECARGSHLLSNHLSNSSLKIDELIYQHAGTTPESLVMGAGAAVPELCAEPMTAGSCLVFDDRILHRGLANQSNTTRHIAYFSYRRKGYLANTHFESQRSLYDAPG